MNKKTQLKTEYIDSSIFLGMHHVDNKVRIACKNFFVKKLKENAVIKMNLEQVGKSDNVIWQFNRSEQDSYYPFMDTLHTVMHINRVPYRIGDINIVLQNKKIQALSLLDRFAVVMPMNDKGFLYTINQKILGVKGLPAKTPKHGKELSFPADLEKLYKKSLKLRIGYRGIIPPLITPVDVKGNVCEQSVKNLIDFVTPFSTALMPTLSSGEGWALNGKQFRDMINFTVKHAGGLPVLAGVEYKTTEEVIKNSLIAKKLGVDAIVITTPFKKDISQKEIFNHFKKIKEKVGLPIFIYNEKSISGNDISFETIKKISKQGNIVGIKEASGLARFTKKLLKLGVPVFQGWEHLCCSVEGIAGYIVPLLNLDPEICLNTLKNPTQKNQNKINTLCKKYNILGDDWYVWLKKELHKRGIISTDKTI